MALMSFSPLEVFASPVSPFHYRKSPREIKRGYYPPSLWEHIPPLLLLPVVVVIRRTPGRRMGDIRPEIHTAIGIEVYEGGIKIMNPSPLKMPGETISPRRLILPLPLLLLLLQVVV